MGFWYNFLKSGSWTIAGCPNQESWLNFKKEIAT
jgi:hypothetical protein